MYYQITLLSIPPNKINVYQTHRSSLTIFHWNHTQIQVHLLIHMVVHAISFQLMVLKKQDMYDYS